MEHAKLGQNERRDTSRLPFRTHGELVVQNESWPIHVIEISNSGVLVALLNPNPIELGDKATLTMELDEDNLSMSGQVAHIKEHYIGLECDPSSEEDSSKLSALITQLKS